MKEAYVSYKVAKLLKEKGFDLDTDKVYERSLMACRYEDYPMPTQQMDCRWLREEYKIFIEVGVGTDIDGVFGYMPSIYFLGILACNEGRFSPNVDADDICDFTPQTYEDAVEAALEYVLTNLI